jgi:hypothetical protein
MDRNIRRRASTRFDYLAAAFVQCRGQEIPLRVFLFLNWDIGRANLAAFNGLLGLYDESAE